MLTRFAPFAPFRTFDDLDRLHGELARSAATEPRTFAPAVDVFEEKDAFVVQAELAGIEAKDIQIEIENGILTLKGERKLARDANEDGYRRVERWYGAFSRQFTLPRTVEAERIEASSKDGVLTVRIPKRAEAKSQKISVKTS